MNKRILVGISGKKRSGKNAFGDALAKWAKEEGYEVMQCAFADALKEEVAKATGVTVGYIEDNKANFRLGLQWWGTEFRRELFDQDYLVKKLYDRIVWRQSTGRSMFIIVTDVRFKNEWSMIKDLGGINVRIERPLPWWKRWFNIDKHKSETALDGHEFDCVIRNDSDLDELSRKAFTFYREHTPWLSPQTCGPNWS